MEKLKFSNMDHELYYQEYIKKANIYEDDFERKSLFYLLALNRDIRNHIDSLYNFKDNFIEMEGVNDEWQTSGSLAIITLAFNLYNGFDGLPGESNTSKLSTLDIFCKVDKELFPYLFIAINIRFGLDGTI